MQHLKSSKILILFICMSALSTNAYSQYKNVWLTYSQSKFIYSPGIEANYFFNNRIGIQAGVNSIIHTYNPNQVANVYFNQTFNFYNANVGLSSYFYNKKEQKLGVTVGFKAYYGPNYKFLAHYKTGGYNIYFDSSLWKPNFGVDFGIFYVKNKFTTIAKFDTAQKKIRFGIGYSFGKKK